MLLNAYSISNQRRQKVAPICEIKCERVVSYYLHSCSFVLIDIKQCDKNRNPNSRARAIVMAIFGLAYEMPMNQPHVTCAFDMVNVLHANQQEHENNRSVSFTNLFVVTCC